MAKDRARCGEDFSLLKNLFRQGIKILCTVHGATADHQQVVKIKEQTLAEDHPDRLASQHELAGVRHERRT